MGDATINVEGLGKVYPDGTKALDDVSFTVAPGETFGFLGRNGAGKTTLVSILTTLEEPSHGTAAVCGHDVADERAAVRSRIGASLQQVALDDLMTGREHLDFVGRLAGLPQAQVDKRADELVGVFGLGSSVDKLVAVLSGGTRRRLDLALALMRTPDVLFLDEPTTGLDPQSRRALWEWVRTFAADGGTVLLTTQYLEEADELADRIAVLERGRVAVIDTPHSLKERFGGKQVQVRTADVDENNRLREEFGAAASAVPDGLILDTAGPGLLLKTLTTLARLGVDETRYTVREASLEDVFVRLTGSAPAGDSESDSASGLAAIGRSLATTKAKGGRP